MAKQNKSKAQGTTASPASAVRRWTRRLVAALVVALFAVIFVSVLSGRYQVRPVLSGSMRPGLAVGGVVITERVPVSDIKVRDVIVFNRPGDPSQRVVHRVISIRHSHGVVLAQTQGDANEAEDPWTLRLSGATAYRAVYAVPLLGYPAVWLHSVSARSLLMLIAGVAVAVAAVALWRRDSTSDESTEDPDRQDDSATQDSAELAPH